MNNLSKKQMAVICQMAAKAYKLMSPGLGDISPEEFRHAEIHRAVGKSSLKACSSREYIKLYNHFAYILGMPIKQDNTWSDRDKAAHVLADTLARHELSLSYLHALAKDRFRDRLSGYGPDVILDAIRVKLTDREIMQLVYTINSRGRAKTSSLDAEHDLDPSALDRYEPHADPGTMPPGGLADHFRSQPSPPPDHV